jgi:hypothetical protein
MLQVKEHAPTPYLFVIFTFRLAIESTKKFGGVSQGMGREKLHVLLSTTFNSSRRQIDIMLTKESIRTLVNVVMLIQHE